MDSSINGTPAAADIWRERIAAQQASGLCIREWCRRNQCREPGFYWWRARLNLQPATVKRRASSPGKMNFAEVVVARPADEAMVLRLGNGRELVLPGSMGLQHVATLVCLLETPAVGIAAAGSFNGSKGAR